MNESLTSLICLFHDRSRAQKAFEEVLRANVPQEKVALIGRDLVGGASALQRLTEFDLSRNDLQYLLDGLQGGSVVLAVSSLSHLVEKVEAIFAANQAGPVDEAVNDIDPDTSVGARSGAGRDQAELMRADDYAVLPVAQEYLQVSKRTVDAGGVRIYRRIAEVPVQQQVALEDQQVSIERNPVNRAATETERIQSGEQTVELTETREDLIVYKAAHVIEEVIVGRAATERVERVQETVRRTEIEVERIAPETANRMRTPEPAERA